MLKTAKILTLKACRGLRVLAATARTRWRSQRLLVLCYHSLSLDEEHRWRRPLFFTQEEFQARLELLRRWRMNVLPLGEAVDRLARGTLPPRSAALTFDDGTADFWLLVWPLLKRYEFPATVYATTYYSEKRLPIFSLMCSYLLWKGRDRRLTAMEDLGLSEAVDLGSAPARAAAAEAMEARADREGLDASARNDRARRLAERLDVDYAALLKRRVLQLMTPEEMALAAADGADVQLHTHRHRVPRDPNLFAIEIRENRRRLERATGRPAIHFCYPRGVHFPEFLPWLAAEGVATATTTHPGLATREDHRLLLPRVVDTASLSAVEVEGWLSGVSHFLPRRRST